MKGEVQVQILSGSPFFLTNQTRNSLFRQQLRRPTRLKRSPEDPARPAHSNPLTPRIKKSAFARLADLFQGGFGWQVLRQCPPNISDRSAHFASDFIVHRFRAAAVSDLLFL